MHPRCLRPHSGDHYTPEIPLTVSRCRPDAYTPFSSARVKHPSWKVVMRLRCLCPHLRKLVMHLRIPCLHLRKPSCVRERLACTSESCYASGNALPASSKAAMHPRTLCLHFGKLFLSKTRSFFLSVGRKAAHFAYSRGLSGGFAFFSHASGRKTRHSAYFPGFEMHTDV